MSKKKKIIIALSSILALLVIIAVIYIQTYYRPLETDSAAIQSMQEVDGNLYLKHKSNTGIIIYPGGKVDEKAYAELASLLYHENYTVIIAKMPLRLGILGSDKALDIIDDNSEIEHWIIVGHSLGGTAASIFAEKYPNKVDGLIFLGSYPYKDLSALSGFTLSITGSEDLVIDQKKATEALPNYPKDSDHHIIDGGNHAGFGSYGEQKGDGKAYISAEDQQQQTAILIHNAIKSH